MFRGHISMVSEWMENGDLASYVRLNPDTSKISLCMNVCAGLSYIHANGMVHGDLKAANVVVSSHGTAMIADFGNSQLKDLTLRFTNTTNSGVSVRWAAPELLLADTSPQLTREADVYAYGMTVLEILTGRVPFYELNENQVMLNVVFQRKTPVRPTVGVSDEQWEILRDCWARDESKRPKITSVEQRLGALYPRRLRGTSTRSSSSTVRFAMSHLTSSTSDIGTEHGIREDGRKRPLSSKELGGSSYKKSRLDVAEPQHQKVVLNQKALDYLYTLQETEGLAMAYSQQGRLSDTEHLMVEVVTARREALGEDHPDTLHSMANLAVAYYKQGRLADAELLEAKVANTRVRVLGENHPDTLQSTANLAITYSQLGRLEDAERLMVKAVAIQKQALGAEHPETLRCLTNLATIYSKQKNMTMAESLRTEVMAIRKRTQGAEHPNTLQSMAHLAATYAHQGRLVDAESLGVEVVAIQKRILGEDHPDTLWSMANLAMVCYNLNRLTDAERLEAAVVVAHKRTLGDSHPGTMQSIRNLALTYEAQGRHVESEALITQLNMFSRTPKGSR